MYRQSPSRNQRSKGIKVKDVLRSCLLLAVCFWLIYQVKHSHDKRKEFDASDGRGLLKRESSDDIIKLGRKGIQAGSEGTFSKHEESKEEETAGEEVDENKSEEDELEDKKIGEREDEAMGGGDDDMDEHEQEKSDEDVDREEDLVDEEKEREDVAENDSQETDSEDAHDRAAKDISAEEGDHDGDDGSVDEAREEHYKADDASSAVTHDAQIATTENENEHTEYSKDNSHNILEGEKENKSEGISDGENRKDLEVEGGELTADDRPSNTTTSEPKEGMLDKLENGSSLNKTVTEMFDAPLTINSSTPEVRTENHDLPSQNETESKPELDNNPDILTNDRSAEGSDFKITNSSQANNFTVDVDSSHLGSHSTDQTELKHAEVHSGELSDSSNNESSGLSNNNTESSGNTIMSEVSVEAGTDGSLPEKDKINVGNSDTNDDTVDTLESRTSENHVDDQSDTIDISDTSNSLEENDAHTDLDTLPESHTEGTNSKDVASE